MTILEKARLLESRIARTLNHAAGQAVGPSAREPLEVVHAILDAVEREVQAGSRGGRVFPFTSVTVSIATPTDDARARIEALWSAGASLRERIAGRLGEHGCDVAALRVEVEYVTEAATAWTDPDFQLTFERKTTTDGAPVPDQAPPRIYLSIVRGTAERPSYALSAGRIDIGRGAEVRDRRNRLLRTNHVVFADSDAAENQTVSRQHAHIVCDASGCRLYDDGSSHGTGIIREGRSVPVPPGSRGVRLRSGDEVVFGEARVSVRIGG